MAKVLYGAAITDARGKLGGIVYSKNRNGAYIRQKVSPTQTPTTRRTIVRERLAELANKWATDISPSEVAEWNAWAAANPVTDIFGRSQRMTGMQAFCKINAIRMNYGGELSTAVPFNNVLQGITGATITADASAQTISIAFDPTPTEVDVVIGVWATPQIGAGRTYTKNLMRFLASSNDAQTSPYAVGAAYVAKYGALVEDRNIAFMVNAVDIAGGLQTPGLYVRTTVVA